MICRSCEVDLPEESFGWRNAEQGRRMTQCRSCRHAYDRDWHERSYERRAGTILGNARRIRADRLARLHAIKAERGCVDCGESDPVVLDFDHLRDKIMNIGDLVGQGHAWSVIEAEIAKCQVVCANCHRRRTHARRAATRGGGAAS